MKWVVLLMLLYVPLVSAGTVQLQAEPVFQGEVLRVSIYAHDLVNVSALQVSLRYDPALLSYNWVQLGDFMGHNTRFERPMIADGALKSLAIIRNDGNVSSGSGEIGSVYFATSTAYVTIISYNLPGS